MNVLFAFFFLLLFFRFNFLLAHFFTPKEQGYFYTFGSVMALQVFLELGFALYYFGALVVAIYIRKWASVPFLWLFFSGFSYMSILSFADMKLFRRLAMDEPVDDAQSASNFVQ